jgi:deferrochelatase/peroxidase EfeB
VSSALLERIQAHVFRSAGHHLRAARFFFVRIPDAAAGRRLLALLLDRSEESPPLTLSDAAVRALESPPKAVAAFGVTREGLELFDPVRFTYRPLELRGDAENGPGSPNDFADPFVNGLFSRRELLGDVYPEATPFFDGERPRFNALVWLAFDPSDGGGGLGDDLEEGIAETGCAIVVDENAETGPEGVRVFGYLDGRSQPYLSEFGSSSPERLAGGGTPTPDGWQPVRAGEFVLGLLDEGGEADVPQPAAVARYGTFLVYRKYVVDEEAFERLIQSVDGRPDEELAAKLMGRHRVPEQGSASLVAAARHEGGGGGGDADGPYVGFEDAVMRIGRFAGIGRQSDWHNDFRYEDDTAGFVCPLGAHIRRANPRDGLGFDGSLTRRHRIIRRGTSDGGNGFHFVGINAHIRDQFEFIQRLWFNTGESFLLGTDRDIFAGSPRTDGTGEEFIVQGLEPRIVRVERPLAELQGGEYFLMPGMDGLRVLRGDDT